MLKANMIAANTLVSPEVNVALVIFAVVVVVLALILAAIILTRTEKLERRPGRAAILRGPAAEPISQSKVVISIPPSTPAFEINDLEISPARPKEGETVTIAFNVVNTGNDAGDYSAELQVDGSIVAVERVVLNPGTIKPVSCTATGFHAGEHEVRVGELEGKFVLPEADISVTALDINPRQAKEGEKVTVIAEVTNDGGVTGTHKLELKIDGRTAAEKEVSVLPGETELVTFEVFETQAGEHKVEVGGLEDKFVIPEADIGVTALDINPRQVREGEKVTVTAEVTNNSAVTDPYKLELRLGGVFLAAQEFLVAPRVSQRALFYLRNLKPGVYRIAIGNISNTFMVGMENHHRKIPSIR